MDQGQEICVPRVRIKHHLHHIKAFTRRIWCANLSVTFVCDPNLLMEFMPARDHV